MENHQLLITTSDCTLEFSKQFVKGVFFVLELDAIKRNCEVLQFPLAKPWPRHESMNTFIERNELIIHMAADEHAYYQIIMQRNLSKRSLNRLLKEPASNYAVYHDGELLPCGWPTKTT